jgi:hypothetical protein
LNDDQAFTAKREAFSDLLKPKKSLADQIDAPKDRISVRIFEIINMVLNSLKHPEITPPILKHFCPFEIGQRRM